MSILPIGTATPLTGPAVTSGISSTSQATAATAPTTATGAAPSGSGGFSGLLGSAIDNLQATQANADSLATQAATGTLTNVADYMVAAEQANVQTQLTSAVRNNALQAFQQIMGMQL
jgi:flagellar hook-basal body complex protein FliE